MGKKLLSTNCSYMLHRLKIAIVSLQEINLLAYLKNKLTTL